MNSNKSDKKEARKGYLNAINESEMDGPGEPEEKKAKVKQQVRLYYLDWLRTLAIYVVLIEHALVDIHWISKYA